MNSNEYLREVNRTVGKYLQGKIDEKIEHAILGIGSESGELIDVLKKSQLGREPDMENLDEEFGDLMWYIGLYCSARGITLNRLMDINTAKLRVRYPDGFDRGVAYEHNRNRQAESSAMASVK